MPHYKWNWHHHAICKLLNDWVDGKINRLIIEAPPRHGKSEIVSRRLPAYILGRHPDDEVIACSVTSDLANRMSRDVQKIIEDKRYYPKVFPNTALSGLNGDQRQAKATKRQDFFEIVGPYGARGSYRAAGVGGTIVGMGARWAIIDDPYSNAEEALSPTTREKIWDWYQSTFYTRLSPDARVLITHTRWHQDDLVGKVLKNAKESGERWVRLTLPGISTDVLDPLDQRTGPGEALWPGQYGIDWLNTTRKAISSKWWSSLYQQSPRSDGDTLFSRNWFGRFIDGGTHWIYPGGGPFAKADCQIVASVDPAASERDKSDYTAILVAAITPINDVLILESIRERMAVHEIPKRMQGIARKYKISHYLVEDNGFQMMVIDAARMLEGMPPIRELRHGGKGKVVRATPAIIKAESGGVFVPNAKPEWLEPWFDELEAFRGEDETNDQVDAFAYLISDMPRPMAGEDDSDSERKRVTERVNTYGR